MDSILLGDMVGETLRDYTLIKKEYNKHRNFILSQPWIVSVPDTISIEEAIAFKEEFFLDTYSKVYNQLKKKNVDLIDKGPQLVYYYKIVPDLYKTQIKEGGMLGAKDKKGRLITGSNLILDKQAINLSKFLSFYYTTHN